MNHRLRGFTLVEMMVILAVITILAMMAVPSYFDRVVRQQIEAGLPLADIAKQPVVSSWALTQTFPADNAAAGLPVADKIVNNHISAVTLKDGAINLTFGNRAANAIVGKILTLRPAVVLDAPIVPVAWVCGFAETPDKMTVRGDNLTNIPDLYLPLACRALKR